MTYLILAVFFLGYVAIALEHKLHINKAATALLIGTVCWTLYLVDLPDLLPVDAIPSWFRQIAVNEQASEIPLHYAIDVQHLHQTGEIASILFFLVGAMTIVELIDAHEGFSLVTDRIHTRSRRGLLWTVGLMTFFLSAALDNLTTTIVTVSVLKKIISDRGDRLKFVGMVVIAANAGGAWTVIGDVTTTMLWIRHKLGAVEVMGELFLGSVVCLLVPLIGMSWRMPGTVSAPAVATASVAEHIRPWHQWLFLILGLAGLLFVPAFKALTHLPPYMGMMLSLSVLWVVSECVGRTFEEDLRTSTGVHTLLRRIDMSSILFFLGILLAVGALSATGLLRIAADSMDSLLPGRNAVAIAIGLVSAIMDNVPLVAAGIEMYDLPMNDPFWMLLAYCAGTGGSCLIIGSAAGVAAMGLDHIDFVWYVRKISGWALLGYLAGAAVVVTMQSINS
ncbi:sodium:proton antiporter NhaD [Rubripirellula reticaptiva]|uniref:Na(+)/H(+) antiporter NhaD n=1 Tax=Rubripirellula reticaptiva TaxID=2528013 RepID=A0A5C6EDV0_9BACT|nr:sodium:proton antiporter NhaD [Rubripirellula reticaptiva]TWU47008.1 Na(+)/H(+) antiporter NhaD [Rubripirellula reticaptiva]